MAITNNETAPGARQRMLDRARERFPDRTFADIGAAPQEGVSDLDDAIEEILEDLTTRQAATDENNRKLVDLFLSDPSAAEFVQKWVETKDPRAALVETFGDELGMGEEARREFGGQLERWRGRKAENDRLAREAEDNWQASLGKLQAWGDGKGLSMEEQRDVMLRLLDITFRGMENSYTEDDFDLALNAIRHDSDVATARREGEVAGRNQRIAAQRRDRATAGSMPPAPVGRQGGGLSDAPPRKGGSFWGEVNKG